MTLELSTPETRNSMTTGTASSMKARRDYGADRGVDECAASCASTGGDAWEADALACGTSGARTSNRRSSTLALSGGSRAGANRTVGTGGDMDSDSAKRTVATTMLANATDQPRFPWGRGRAGRDADRAEGTRGRCSRGRGAATRYGDAAGARGIAGFT